ncbi:MAG: hypothetical protein ABSE97_04835 [Verrucomicrobiota bacterium]|jgi:hypothetical protein
MKIPLSQKWAAVCVSILAMTAALKSSADQTATAPQPGETYTGIITAINPQGRVLDVKNKKFNLSDTCTYTIVGKDTGSVGDLHPGQQVTVSYHITSVLPADRAQQEPETAAGGQKIMVNNYYYTNDVFVADSVQQELMTRNGTVRTNDLTHHTLMLRFLVLNKTFKIADDCQIILSDGKNGAITDIQSGNYVTVTYETPGGDEAVAHKIAQTDAMLINGRVIEINQTNRTITTATVLNYHPKKFHLADNCTIAVNGKTNAPLSDIKIFDKLVFTYNNIKGVNIVNYITTNTPTLTTNEPTSLSIGAKSQQQKQKKQIQVIRSPRMQSMQ